MKDKKREEHRQQPNQEETLEDLQPVEAQTDSVKGGQRGGGTWIFSGN
jgi:hypothetical protein